MIIYFCARLLYMKTISSTLTIIYKDEGILLKTTCCTVLANSQCWSQKSRHKPKSKFAHRFGRLSLKFWVSVIGRRSFVAWGLKGGWVDERTPLSYCTWPSAHFTKKFTVVALLINFRTFRNFFSLDFTVLLIIFKK